MTLLLTYSSIITYKLVNNKPNIVTTIIPGDTVFTTVSIPTTKLVPYKVEVPKHDTLYITNNIDSLKKEYTDLYDAYYTSNSYRDTAKIDSSAEVIVSIKVKENTVESLEIGLKNDRVTVINTTVVNNEKKYGIGAMVGLKSIVPMMTYTLSNKYNIVGGYEVYSKSPQVGIIYKF